MKYIFSIYIWLFGALGYLLIFIGIFILNIFVKKDFLYSYLRFTSKVLLKILFIRTKVIYEQKIDKSENYIFMPNHVSMFDVLLASAYWPINVNAIEAQSHFKWFLYGKIITIFEQIPINRKNPRESLKSFEIAKQRVKNVRSVIVFPEGHRSKNGKLRNFKKLPFKFAKDAGVAVIPVAFIGVEKIAPEESIWIKPAKTKIIFGKKIEYSEIQKLSAQELSTKVKNEIERMKKQYEFTDNKPKKNKN